MAFSVGNHIHKKPPINWGQFALRPSSPVTPPWQPSHCLAHYVKPLPKAYV
jgi:hypothetical protein